MLQKQGLRIVQLLIQDTGTYGTQFRRPYHTEFDQNKMNIVMERLGSEQKFGASSLAGVAGQFLRPMAVPEDPNGIMIPQGWGESRLRFMMKLQYSYGTTGTVISEIVLGYTNHMGATVTGAIDPRMEFYVNSVTQTKEFEERTPMGIETRCSVFDKSHILANNDWNGAFQSPREFRMRPMDVYSQMQTAHIDTKENVDVYDGRVLMNNMAAKSKRSNNLPAKYAADILQGWRAATHDLDLGGTNEQIASKAKNLAAEGSVSTDPFLQALSNIRGGVIGNAFTYRDLMEMDPNVDNVAQVLFTPPMEKAQQHHAGQTMPWSGSDRETLTATILSQAVPGLLMELGLTKAVFRTTNHDFSGQTFTQFYDIAGLGNGDYSIAAEVFKTRLESEILADVSYNSQISFLIEMQVDLLGETWIKVSLDGSPLIDFVTPSFCDALMTPVVTQNVENANTLATDFEVISTALNNSGCTGFAMASPYTGPGF